MTVDRVGLMGRVSGWSSLEDALSQLRSSIPFPSSEIWEAGVSKAQGPTRAS